MTDRAKTISYKHEGFTFDDYQKWGLNPRLRILSAFANEIITVGYTGVKNSPPSAACGFDVLINCDKT